MSSSGLAARSSSILSRRTFLGGAAAIATLPWLPTGLLAKTAAYTFKHGDFAVTTVSDGNLVLPTSLLAPDAPPAERLEVLKSGGATGENFEPPTNATLVRSGSDLILFDTGAGTGFMPSAGKLFENLTAAGIDPASITKIVFTHGHPDHIWGTVMADGTLRYPRASYYVAAAEWDFWNDKDLLGKAPKEMTAFVVGAQRNYSAIKDRTSMVKPGDDIVTGIRVLDTPGHTPGHVSFEVAGDDGLIIVGDALLAPWLYFPHPDWTFGFDAISDVAIASRKKLLDRVATDRTKMIGYHWPGPGIGHAERKDNAYRYVPAA